MVSYDDLLAAAKKYPQTTDFMALRLAYAESPGYAPYERYGKMRELNQALEEHRLQEALVMLDEMLDENYLNIDGHLISGNVFRELKDAARSQYHFAWVDGLLTSIIKSGQGVSFETAMIVINTQEEYQLLRALRFRSSGQRLINNDGHSFDIMTALREEEKREFYFNIDLPFGWLARSRSEKK